MGSRSTSVVRSLVFVPLLTILVSGCGGEVKPDAPVTGQGPAEKQANSSMEDFMKKKAPGAPAKK